MNGAILREMALVGAANSALAGGDVSRFWPDADAFVWMRAYRFVDETGSEVAPDPLEWFAALASEGRRGVRVSIGPAERLAGAPDIPAHQLSGFLCGGPVWRLEAVGATSSAYWRALDEVYDDPPADKPSGVQCVRLAEGVAADGDVPDLAAALVEFEAALPPMIAIADQGLENFADLFRTAQRFLSDPQAIWPAQGYYLDFQRWARFDARRMRILAAVTHAWVFGGMGSWNDVGPDGPDTERLFTALQKVCAGLANSTYRGE